MSSPLVNKHPVAFIYIIFIVAAIIYSVTSLIAQYSVNRIPMLYTELAALIGFAIAFIVAALLHRSSRYQKTSNAVLFIFALALILGPVMRLVMPINTNVTVHVGDDSSEMKDISINTHILDAGSDSMYKFMQITKFIQESNQLDALKHFISDKQVNPWFKVIVNNPNPVLPTT